MANVAIPNLPTVTSVTGLEQIPAVQNGVTVRLTAAQIAGLTPVGSIYTVATLPASPIKGQSAFVSDATSPTFLGIVTGGGSTFTRVFFNGSNWVAG